jgi:hypothetical protein
VAYVPVPKDLTKIKTKVIFNLTKRQLICFSLGALAGVPIFFLLRSAVNISIATLIMIVVMMPFFLFAMYEKNGMPFEQILKNIIEARYRRPQVRLYQTNNFYTILQRQAKLDREVQNIAQKNQRALPHQSGAQRDRRRRSPGARC